MKKTIVIIENDPSIREMLSFILSNQGFNAIALMSNEDTLQTIIDLNPCCVVLDVVRVTDLGTALCRQLRNSKGTSHIPVIALSTQLNAMTLRGFLVDEVVLKPFDIDELLVAVEKLTGVLNMEYYNKFEQGSSCVIYEEANLSFA